jgi:hypothetical protein
MFSKHLIRMLLGLLITGVVGMVSLFLINEYDKKQGGQNGTFSNYSARAGLRN